MRGMRVGRMSGIFAALEAGGGIQHLVDAVDDAGLSCAPEGRKEVPGEPVARHAADCRVGGKTPQRDDASSAVWRSPGRWRKSWA